MGVGGGFKSFFEKFSERRSQLPQNTQKADLSLAVEICRTIRPITYFNNALLSILRHLSIFATVKKTQTTKY